MDAVRKVLVIDDDPVVGKSFDRVLSANGYAVITARNGEEALSKLHSEAYDVVFTDIKMPGMNGLEVAERVRASQPWLPVVIVTGYGTDAYEARAKAAGVSGFLHKPLSPEMIEGSAQKALLEKMPAAALPAAATPAVATAPAAVKQDSMVKNVALFFAAPFIGLAYFIAFPFIGLGVLAWKGGQELVKYRTVKKIAVPGKATNHHIERLLLASLSSAPQLAFGGGEPKPRNERELSIKIADAIPNVMGTSTGARALGRICRSIIRSGPTPAACAAMTNSLERSRRNSPRASLAMPVQLVIPMIAIVFQIVGFSTNATSAKIRTSVGMHITTSVIRLATRSIQPPK